MKLNIDCFIVELDFKYTNSFRDIRKGEKPEYMGHLKYKKPIIITTCTFNDGRNILTDTIQCDSVKHNREFARKYVIKKTIKTLDRKYRAKVWKAYFDYIKAEKLESVSFGDLGFIKNNGKITIEYLGYCETITEEHRKLLIKLLK